MSPQLSDFAGMANSDAMASVNNQAPIGTNQGVNDSQRSKRSADMIAANQEKQVVLKNQKGSAGR